jgi:hypothetical protein
MTQQATLTCKIGADPEFFLKRKSDGVIVSAYGLLPGSKDKPYPVKDGAVQVDGMAAEININAASSEDEFVHNLQSVMAQLRAMLPDYELVHDPIHQFSSTIWDKTHKDAKQLGCVPDLNAWTGLPQAPEEKQVGRYRTTAGHIHIGWAEGVPTDDAGHIEACRVLVRELDRGLGLPLAYMSGNIKQEHQRWGLYGRFGSMRVKPYGVEYRTPSSFWLESEDTMRFVYRQTVATFNNLLKGEHFHQQKSSYVAQTEVGNFLGDYDQHAMLTTTPNVPARYFEAYEKKLQERKAVMDTYLKGIFTGCKLDGKTQDQVLSYFVKAMG